jgi:hypothetical protein
MSKELLEKQKRLVWQNKANMIRVLRQIKRV